VDPVGRSTLAVPGFDAVDEPAETDGLRLLLERQVRGVVVELEELESSADVTGDEPDAMPATFIPGPDLFLGRKPLLVLPPAAAGRGLGAIFLGRNDREAEGQGLEGRLPYSFGPRTRRRPAASRRFDAARPWYCVDWPGSGWADGRPFLCLMGDVGWGLAFQRSVRRTLMFRRTRRAPSRISKDSDI
jgi:hypothetical protein